MGTIFRYLGVSQAHAHPAYIEQSSREVVEQIEDFDLKIDGPTFVLTRLSQVNINTKFFHRNH